MRVIRNINNNVALCLDSEGREVVAFGRGIGFSKAPQDVPLSQVERTFYIVDASELAALSGIGAEYLSCAAKVLDAANALTDGSYGTGITLTLADHIQFAVETIDQREALQLQILCEVRSAYPLETTIGDMALGIIERELGVRLPAEESASIALHFVDKRTATSGTADTRAERAIDDVARLVEETFDVKVDRGSFAFSRFSTHMYYLMARTKALPKPSAESAAMFRALERESPLDYACALKAKSLIDDGLTDDELLYLAMHINRLRSHSEPTKDPARQEPQQQAKS